jgi:uncharacterized protein YdeI (YjbR/CyaY-like superfamily)
MENTDDRIDDYILKSADFAKPILSHLRALVHKACPKVVETIKWSFPNFEYNGSILCSMASFKQHCSFGFWLGSQLKDPHNVLSPVGEKTAMGHLGQIRNITDLPSDTILVEYIHEAMKLTEQGVRVSKAKAVSSASTKTPPYFLEELEKNKVAFANFEKFTPSQKKEYLTWIAEAKTEVTRNKRMATAIEWIAEGKGRNSKYERK